MASSEAPWSDHPLPQFPSDPDGKSLILMDWIPCKVFSEPKALQNSSSPHKMSSRMGRGAELSFPSQDLGQGAEGLGNILAYSLVSRWHCSSLKWRRVWSLPLTARSHSNRLHQLNALAGLKVDCSKTSWMKVKNSWSSPRFHGVEISITRVLIRLTSVVLFSKKWRNPGKAMGETRAGGIPRLRGRIGKVRCPWRLAENANEWSGPGWAGAY